MRRMATRPCNAPSTNGITDPRLVLDSAPALIHTALPDGYLDFFNESWLRYVGLPLENFRRMSASGFKENEKVSVGENCERFVCS
jgi:hypothetical protein